MVFSITNFIKGCSLKGNKGRLIVCKFWFITPQMNISQKSILFLLIGSIGFKTKKLPLRCRKKSKLNMDDYHPDS